MAVPHCSRVGQFNNGGSVQRTLKGFPERKYAFHSFCLALRNKRCDRNVQNGWKVVRRHTHIASGLGPVMAFLEFGLDLFRPPRERRTWLAAKTLSLVRDEITHWVGAIPDLPRLWTVLVGRSLRDACGQSVK